MASYADSGRSAPQQQQQGNGAVSKLTALDLKTRQIANLLNQLVEHLHPKASLRTFSEITKQLFNATETSSNTTPSPSTATVSHIINRSFGGRAQDLFVALTQRDEQVATKVSIALLELARLETESGGGKRQDEDLNAGDDYSFNGGVVAVGQKDRLSSSSLGNALSKEKHRQVMKDFLTALQGVEGHFLRKQSFSQLDQGVVVILQKALELGKVHVKISQFSSRLVSESSQGLVCQRLGHAIRDELDGFDRFLSILEQHCLGKESGDALTSPYQAHAWTLGIARRIQMIWQICQSVEGLRGGALASAVFAFCSLGNPVMNELANRLLFKCFKPLENIAMDFIQTGRLQLDTHSEFFVTRVKQQQPSLSASQQQQQQWIGAYENDAAEMSSDVKMYDEFVLNISMIPTFIGKDLALRVMSTGSESKVAKRLFVTSSEDQDNNAQDGAGGEADESETEEEEQERIALSKSYVGDYYLQRMSRQVSFSESSANRRILRSLFGKHMLEEHLLGLKQLMLLGQGDFAQILVELASPTLTQSTDDISRMELLSHLENAFQYSNASRMLNEDVLARVDVRVLDEFPTGWDAFSLDYLVPDFPLNLVINNSSRERYRKGFRFLWKLKRVQYSLEAIWKRHSGTRLSEYYEQKVLSDTTRSVLHKSHLLRAEMYHFVTNLCSYIMFEVLETSWEQFRCDLKASETVSDLLGAHEQYLKSILTKAMIADNDSIMESEDNSEHSFESTVMSPSSNGGLPPQSARKKKFGAPMSKSPLFSLRTADVSYRETKQLSVRLNQIFDIVLKFCGLQERLFTRIAEEQQLLSLRRRRKMDLERQKKWGLAKDETEPDDDEDDDQQLNRVSQEHSSSIAAISNEFWEALNAFLVALESCSSENLRFLALKLNFNNFF